MVILADPAQEAPGIKGGVGTSFGGCLSAASVCHAWTEAHGALPLVQGSEPVSRLCWSDHWGCPDLGASSQVAVHTRGPTTRPTLSVCRWLL